MLSHLGKLIYEGFADWMNKEVEAPVIAPSDLSRAAPALVAGDVILVEGRTRIGRLIKNVSQSPWTHCAIFVGRISDHRESDHYQLLRNTWDGDENEYLLLEAEIGSGALLTAIDKYVTYNVRICRPQSLTRRDADAVMNHALNRLDHEYDVRQLFDLARLMYPYSLIPRRWRSTLFETSSVCAKKRTICSTLVADAFYSVDFPIRPIISKDNQGNLQMNNLNARLCTPRDFDASPYFVILKFPWIPISNPGVYRHLPWEDEPPPQPESQQMPGSPQFGSLPEMVTEVRQQLSAYGALLFKSLRSLLRPAAK